MPHVNGIEITNEINTVRICYGYGIVFSIDVIAKIGTHDEVIKQKAIEHFKQFMPTLNQVNDVENKLANKKAWIEVKHEFD